jgi:hypothetical protein
MQFLKNLERRFLNAAKKYHLSTIDFENYFWVEFVESNIDISMDSWME